MVGVLPESIRTRSTKAEFSHVFSDSSARTEVASAFDRLCIANLRWIDVEQARAFLVDFVTKPQNGEGARSYLWPVWMIFGVEMLARAEGWATACV